MKRKILVWIMAIAATLSMAAPVSAAVTNRGNAGRYYVDANGDGICDNFVDKDGDGICDNCDLVGGRGRYFVDKNGDGICDNDPRQCGRGGCCRGRGLGGGRGLGRGRF